MKTVKQIVDVIYQFDKRREAAMANKIEELKELIMESSLYPKKEEPKKTNPVLIILAVLGAIAAVAAIAYAVYYFIVPEDSEDFEDFEDFEDDDLDDDWDDQDNIELD